MKIVIRTDGSRDLGMGHVTRSVAVADALRGLGAEVVFRAGEKMAQKYIKRLGWSLAKSEEANIIVDDDPPTKPADDAGPRQPIRLADLLTGPAMMPIRREVVAHRERRRHGYQYGVLVTAGWSDSWGLLDEMRDRAKPSEALFIPTTPESMLEAAERCSLAIVTMGVTAWELACIGTPMIIVPPTARHDIDSRPLAEAGVADVIHHTMLRFDLARRVRELLSDNTGCSALSVARRARLTAMSHAGRALVDGLGARRVAEKIMEEAGRC
jgi:spore coat polysaccharide biosynthesis predicted glycosyltransferase SpsG